MQFRETQLGEALNIRCASFKHIALPFVVNRATTQLAHPFPAHSALCSVVVHLNPRKPLPWAHPQVAVVARTNAARFCDTRTSSADPGKHLCIYFHTALLVAMYEL